MENLSHNIVHLCELVTSLLIRRIQMGEMSTLGWLMGLFKHAIWVHCISFIYCYFQFPNPSFIPAYPVILFVGMLDFLMFIEDPLETVAIFTELHD
jgi:hypothetical protein